MLIKAVNETNFNKKRSRIQAQIDKVSSNVPDEVLEAKRITDAAIAAKERELGSLINQRNRIDEAYQVSQREAAERAAYERDRVIKEAAQRLVATNSELLRVLDKGQAQLKGLIECIDAARNLLPVGQEAAADLSLPNNSFGTRDFNRRLSEWLADELTRAWPIGSEPLGAYVSWKPPPSWLGGQHKQPQWSSREMDPARAENVEAATRMIEERAHIR